MAAVAALLTSCSKDETTTAPVIERSKVTFTVNAPELSTRAEDDYGTGHTAKTLDYVIYDLAEEAGKNQITGTTTFPDGELETTVTVDLVEGREYEAIFFAHAEDAPYTFNKTEQTMTINTTSLKANAESYDAFYKYVEPFVMPATGLTKDVEMTRPFAQLNVATNDFDTQAGKLIDAATTGIEVEAYNTLNFKDGTVDGKETIIYALADKMDGTISANNENYSWLTMNYILVNTKENVGVTFLFTDEDKDGNKQTYTREYSAVPVQRNHKTNIIGSILTSETKFNVEILPGFEAPEHDYNVDTTDETVVKTVQELQAAINAATAGTNIIKLGANITTKTTRAANDPAIVIPQKEGINIVIDGDGHTYDGTIYIDGNARHTGAETLTFTNIKFKHSSGPIYFIDSNLTTEAGRYAHNVTIENCTFTGNTNGAVVGARFRQGYNINIVNCTAKDVFLLLWATGGKGITVDGADVTVASGEYSKISEGGLSFGTSTDIVVKNSTITNNNQAGYGVRVADNSTANNINITLENNTIKANYPVVARYMNVTNADDKSDCKDNVNMTFNGVNTLTATNANGYQVVFTHDNDNAALAEPEGATITLTGADSYNVFPRDLVIATAEELKEFRDAVNNGTDYKGKVVKLAANIDLNNESWTPIGGDDRYANNFAGTFDGQGHIIKNLKVENAQEAGLFGTMTKGVIKNLTIDDVNLSADHYAGGIVGWAEAGGGSLTIENCHVKNATIKVSVKDNDLGDKAGGIIGFSYKNTIIGCSVEKTTIEAYRDCGGIVGYANGGTVKNNTVKDGVKLIQNNDNNYNDYTTEEAVNFGDIVGRRAGDILEGGNSGTVTKQGGIFDGYYITTDENNVPTLNVFNITGIEKALKAAGAAGAGNTNVNLAKGEYDMTDVDWTPIDVDGYHGADIATFEGNGSVIKGLDAALFAGGFAGGSGIVIKNLTIENANMIANNTQGYGAFVNCADSMEEITLINCHLKNSTIITPNDGATESRIGGLVGWTSGYSNQNDGPVKTYVTIEDCSVIGCTLKGAGSIGAICGHAGANAATFTIIEDCVVKDNKLISNEPGSWRVGVVVGTANNGQCEIKNITESGNTLSQIDKTAPDGDAKRHYYGRFVPSGTGTLTIDGVAVQ